MGQSPELWVSLPNLTLIPRNKTKNTQGNSLELSITGRLQDRPPAAPFPRRWGPAPLEPRGLPAPRQVRWGTGAQQCVLSRHPSGQTAFLLQLSLLGHGLTPRTTHSKGQKCDIETPSPLEGQRNPVCFISFLKMGQTRTNHGWMEWTRPRVSTPGAIPTCVIPTGSSPPSHV